MTDDALVFDSYCNRTGLTFMFQHLTTGIFGDSGLPGVFIMYELSPMMVKYTERERSVNRKIW